jgi:DNA-binding CsgD family transcriptional regulator
VLTEDNYVLFEKSKDLISHICEIENHPITLFDLNKKEFIYFRPATKHKTSAEYDENNKQLHQFYARVHPDDLAFVFDAKIKTFNFLASQPPTERVNYKLVFNFSMKNEAGVYCHYIQRQIVLLTDNEGKPWLVMNINNLLSKQNIGIQQQRHLVNINTGKFYLFNNELEDGVTQLFTPREKEVFALLAQGLDSVEIAKALNISEHTVNNHRKHVLNKTHAGNTARVLLFANYLGII